MRGCARASHHLGQLTLNLLQKPGSCTGTQPSTMPPEGQGVFTHSMGRGKAALDSMKLLALPTVTWPQGGQERPPRHSSVWWKPAGPQGRRGVGHQNSPQHTQTSNLEVWPGRAGYPKDDCDAEGGEV